MSTTLGLMQAYFFPYLGYYTMIFLCDRYVLFDVSQYTPQSWMNRNRILKPISSKDSWEYITVAIEKCQQNTPSSEVLIKNKEKSLQKILRQIEHYKKYAPYYNEVKEIITNCFINTKTDLLIDLNMESLKAVFIYLDIEFEPFIFSQENIDLPEISYAGQWALEVADYYKADCYLNPPAGKGIFKEEEFEKRGIKLCFMDMPTLEYDCKAYTFEPYLSIVDVLMWNSKDTIKAYLKQKLKDFKARSF